MPGWRLGFAHGPSAIIQRDDQVAAVQFRLCAAAVPMGGRRGDGRRHDAAHRRLPPQARPARRPGWPTTTSWSRPAGRSTPSPKPPGARARSSSHRAIEKHQLLIIPGNVFSRRDTHFRISYAADDAVIERGIEALRKLARASQ